MTNQEEAQALPMNAKSLFIQCLSLDFLTRRSLEERKESMLLVLPPPPPYT